MRREETGVPVKNLDYEQSLFFCSPSSKTLDTQMATRVTDGAPRFRVSRLRRSRARALLSQNLKKKRNCSQSMKNHLQQAREPTTNLTHKWSRHRDLKPRNIGGRRLLSTTPSLLPYTDQSLVELITFRLTLCGQHLPPFLARDH